MFKKSFLGLSQPRFAYAGTENAPAEAECIPVPEKVTLLFSKALNGKKPVLKTGDRVKTGQKLLLCEDCPEYVISSVSGTVSSLSPFTGDFGASYTAVTVKTDAEDVLDESFAEKIAEGGEEAVKEFLATVPGMLPPDVFQDSKRHIETIVVAGVEKDLLAMTRQYVMKSDVGAMNTGISVLKKATGVHKVVIALHQDLVSKAGAIGGASGVELRVIDRAYPSALPRMIMKDVMGQVVPANKTCEDLGVCFVSAEAVASVGTAFLKKRIPVTKTLTVVKKDGTTALAQARIGTSVGDILKAFDISLFDKDRIIAGGPMTGSAIYSLDHPIGPDTDMIMVQDHSDVALVSDYPCINCGECVRICPANVPVSMLVRFLEAKKYEAAADEYDLQSCVECGLCSFVCVSKMPIFQYIRLAKHELNRMRTQEEADV